MAFDLAPFAERRRRFAEAIGDALAVIPAARETARNADTGFEFRQDSDFYFLTGFDEPDAVAVINPAHAKERFVLFVRPRDREMEVWNGRRAGVEGAVATYGADAAYTVDELDAKLREYAIDRTALVYRLGNPHHDPRMIRLVAEMRGVRARGFVTPVRVEDPGPILHELRLRRSPEELSRQRRACEISRDAHIEAMRYARPGQYEYEVQAALEFVFRKNGSPRNAYPSIVASGPNATHPALQREHPAHGGRRPAADRRGLRVGLPRRRHHAHLPGERALHRRPSARIYDVVLRAQLAAIAAARPGNRYEAMHEAARRALVEGLVALGLLPRGVDESLAMHHYREFYMHGTGHWLGMDVHDVGDYRVRRQSRVLEPGMVVTVEPGLYFDPERETVTFYLREYSEEEMWERRYRLGTAAAKKIEDEEKARAEKVEHRVPAEYRGHRRPHRGRYPDHRRRARGPDRGHAEDDRRGRARLRRAASPAAVARGRAAWTRESPRSVGARRTR